MNMKRNIQIVFASALTLLCLGSCTADKTAPPLARKAPSPLR